MRRLEEQLHEDFPPVQLYMDDAELVIHLVMEVSPDVEIEAAGFKLDSPEELRELKYERTKHFRVEGLEPRLSFHFSPGGGAIYAPIDTLAVRGTIGKLKELVAKRHRRWWEVSERTLAFCGFGLSILALFAIPLVLVLALGLYGMLPLLIVAPLWCYVVEKATNAAMNSNSSVLVLREMAEVPSFWARNRDKILVGVIIAFCSAVVSVLLTLLLVRK